MPDGKLIEVISDQALLQVDELYNRLVKAFDLVAQFEKKMPNVKAPSGTAKPFQDTAKAIKEATDAQNTYMKTMKTYALAQEQRIRATATENKETIKLKYETQKLNKETKLQQIVTSGLAGAYEKLNAKLNITANEYRDLAVRKEIGVKLTDEEIKRMGFLENRILKYDAALKKVDGQMGRHQRNVGNYKSGFDGLGFSIAQLSREMPAFANSMQTGFMAISNNIPMLVDEINRLKKANVELASSGQPTVSILKKLGGAILSWQTLISVGVTLLTVFGAKLFDMAFGLSESEKALKAEKEEMEKNTKAIKDNIAQRDLLLKKEKEFLNAPEISRRLDLILNTGLEDSTEEQAILVELADRLNAAGIAGADILKDANLQTAARVQIGLNLIEIAELTNKLEKERAKNTTGSFKEAVKIQERILQLQQANETIAGNIVEIKNKENETDQKIIRNEKTLLSDLERRYQLVKKLAEIAVKTKGMGDTSGIPQSVIDQNQEEFDELQKRQNEKAEQVRKQLATERALEEAFISLGATLGIQQNTVTDLFDSIKNGFDDAGESAQAFSQLFTDVIGAMNAADNERINQRINNLEKEKDLAMAFAGDSASAREQIEIRYQEKVAKLKAKQAQNNKQSAIINSIINTAAAVVKTFAELGFPVGLPAAAIVGGLGAAQTAIIASQPIPEFRDGVRGFEGGFAIVGDGGKNEPITDGSGRLLGVSPDSPTLVNLPKGANVFSDYDAFNSQLNGLLGLNDINPFGGSIFPNIKGNNNSSGLNARDLEKAFSSAINGRPSTVVTMDKNGFRTFVRGQHGQAEVLNNRTTFKGMDV